MYLREGLNINAQGRLEIGGCDAVWLAEQFGTPLYVYDEAYIRRMCRGFTESIAKHALGGAVMYAGKAFSTTALLKILDSEGLGLDCVSGGELYTARKAGFPMERIIFHGSNKSFAEMEMAVESCVGRISIDNIEEIDILADIAKQLGKEQSVLLRVNPGVDAHTHKYIQTARIDSKFGVGMDEAPDALKRILARPELKLTGINSHIGSQIFSMDAYDAEANKLVKLLADLRAETGYVAKEINMGGGFSVHYTDDDQPVSPSDAIERLMSGLRKACAGYEYPVPRLIVEPGRAIVGEACVMLYGIGAIKTIPGIRKYLNIDGGLADNPRPSLYQAEYEAHIANRMNEPYTDKVTIAGRSCETDTLIESCMLPVAKRGDILAVMCSGAYQYAMASNYNKVPVPAVVLVNEGRAQLMVRRQTYQELTQYDCIPDWL